MTYQAQQRSLTRLSDGQTMDTASTKETVPLRMDMGSYYPQQPTYSTGEEVPPIYLPRRYPDGAGVVNQNVPQGPRTSPPSYQGQYWQGVYWPYRYEPYQTAQGAYWPYRYWPNENDAYWQGSRYPYERGARTPRQYNGEASLSPSAAGVPSGSGPLSPDERAELEMWRNLSSAPVEVIFYGNEAFVKWNGAASRIPVPKNGKIQIKLSPQNERPTN